MTDQKNSKAQEELTISEQMERKFEEFRKQYEHVHDKVEDLSDEIIKTTKRKPLLALGVAVAVGVLIGKIFK